LYCYIVVTVLTPQPRKPHTCNSIFTHSDLAESWTLGVKQHRRLQAAEMRYLRRVDQKTRRDKVRNQTIRTVLDVKSLQSQIQQMQFRCFCHVVRKPESRHPRMAWEARYECTRTRGRPRTKWQDNNIQNALLKKGVDWRQARTRTQDREIWHALCQTSTPDGRRGSSK
jgi:hypothetical protein